MAEQRVRRIIPFLTLVFAFVPVADGFAATSDSSSEGIQKLIARGEALMAAGEYAAALDVYVRVLPRVKEKGTKADLLFNQARAAHLMNDASRAEDYLRGLFELDRSRRISDGKYPKTFNHLFEKVKAEYWFSIRADDEYREEAEKQVIANLSRKPKKKKIPTFLIVAVGVVVAAAVVALLILPGGEQETPEEATLIIENRTDWILTVWVGASFEYRVQPWQDWSHTFPAGIYNITVSNGENMRILYSRVLPVSESLIITVDPTFFD